jgi:hypothetical protein
MPQATLRLVLKQDNPPIADLNWATEALTGIVVAPVWALMTAFDPRLGSVGRSRTARWLHNQDLQGPIERLRSVWLGESSPLYPLPAIEDRPRFSPTDPYDASLRYCLNSWLVRTIRQRDPQLYSQFFGFARVGRIERSSPLAVELIVGFGIPVVYTGVLGFLAYSLMSAGERLHRHKAETRIRQAEAALKEEDLKQSRLRTAIVRRATEAVEEMELREIPTELIREVAKTGTTAVGDLGSSSLIGNITLGISGP